jgi:GT2 family glycosyltransferase
LTAPIATHYAHRRRNGGLRRPRRAPLVRCSLLIPTHNRVESLRLCLRDALRQDHPDYEVVVIDDGSTDGTADVVRHEFPDARLLRRERNQRQWVALNHGIRTSRSELIAFLDDDCLAPRGWLRRHDRMHENARVGAVGGPLVSRDRGLYEQYLVSEQIELHRAPRHIERLDAFESLFTGNLSVRRRVLEQVGLFDEAFVMGADVDLVRRISWAGYGLVSDPALAVEHLKRYTLGSFLRERFIKSSGSLMTDVTEATLRARRFVPLIDPVATWRRWCSLRSLSNEPTVRWPAFFALALATRFVEVAGRAYYYFALAPVRTGMGRPSASPNDPPSNDATEGAKSEIDAAPTSPDTTPGPRTKNAPSGS